MAAASSGILAENLLVPSLEEVNNDDDHHHDASVTMNATGPAHPPAVPRTVVRDGASSSARRGVGSPPLAPMSAPVHDDPDEHFALSAAFNRLTSTAFAQSAATSTPSPSYCNNLIYNSTPPTNTTTPGSSENGSAPTHVSRSSDFTLPMSNLTESLQQFNKQQLSPSISNRKTPFARDLLLLPKQSPQQCYQRQQLPRPPVPSAAAAAETTRTTATSGDRRAIFGKRVVNRYGELTTTSSSEILPVVVVPVKVTPGDKRTGGNDDVGDGGNAGEIDKCNRREYQRQDCVGEDGPINISALTEESPKRQKHYSLDDYSETDAADISYRSLESHQFEGDKYSQHLLMSPLTPASPSRIFVPVDDDDSVWKQQPNSISSKVGSHRKHQKQRPHETIHAQSLLLGFAFCVIWAPSNMMAPNLTGMAETFGFDDSGRNLYLGSYVALATGVFSFPIGAGIGFCADFMSRQVLYCFCVLGSGLSALATAYSAKTQCYWHLFMARLLQGGFMSGSVPVAFSFLGDLFATEERNAASSGLTAMMGMGIAVGQVYAGNAGAISGWDYPFYVSAIACFFACVLVLQYVQEPVRGGKEKVLQKMIKAGTRYERKLTMKSFIHAMQHNRSNRILLWQGFFSSLPWGVVFVFLNDYLSQERGFSVPDATYMVFVFGWGCAAGGIIGGHWGQKLQMMDVSYLPIFMALSTGFGIVPFLAMLNSHFTEAHGWRAHILALSCGIVASMPAVNVRPCLINVNPPETRGASLTAANLLIQLGRGMGPSCITLTMSFWHWEDRRMPINISIVLFWLTSAIQLSFLAKTLPDDQDAMETELAKYAEQVMASARQQVSNGGILINSANAENDDDTTGQLTSSIQLAGSILMEDDDASLSIVSIEDRITSFDQTAARESFKYIKEGLAEIKEEIKHAPLFHCGVVEDAVSSSSSDTSQRIGDDEECGGARHGIETNHNPTETSPLVGAKMGTKR